MKKLTKFKGYTLLEIIFGILLLSGITLLISQVFSQSLIQYKDMIRKSSKFWDGTKIYFLNRVFQGVIDYYVKDEEWFPFFEGNSHMVSFVSQNPLGETLPVLVIIKGEKKGLDKYDLIYYEIPVLTFDYKDLINLVWGNNQKMERDVLLYDGLRKIKFEFFGYEALKNKPEWYSSFSGKRNKMLPLLVRINLQREHDNIEIYFELKTRSNLKDVYKDIY